MGQPTVFLSYRTTNSRFARLIASWLKHNGVKVWFAEERIGLDSQFDLSGIRDSLAQAIRSCSHFLILTNADFIDSKWCKLEAHLIRLIMNRRGASVIEIGIPSDELVRKQFTFLARQDVGFIELSPGAVPDFSLIEAEMRRRKWAIPKAMSGLTKPGGHDLATSIRTPFGINVPFHGWREADEEPPLSVANEESTLGSRHFRRDDPVPMEAAVSFITFNRETENRPSVRDSTDREVRDWAIRSMPEVFSDSITRSNHHAVHLDFLWGRAHLGATYTLTEHHPSLGKIAVRKHWAYMYSPDSRKDMAVIITFFVYGGLRRLIALSPLFEFHLQVLEHTLAPWLHTKALPTHDHERVSVPVQDELPKTSKEGHERMSDLPDALRSAYAVFQKIPLSESPGGVYRLRRAIRWATGRW